MEKLFFTQAFKDRARGVKFARRPQDLDDEGVLADLASKANLCLGEAAHLAEFDLQKIKVLRRRLQVLPAHDLLPLHASLFLANSRDLIEKSTSELATDADHSEPVEPHGHLLFVRTTGFAISFTGRSQLQASSVSKNAERREWASSP